MGLEEEKLCGWNWASQDPRKLEVFQEDNIGGGNNDIDDSDPV